jgi:hypothetical protein
VAETPRSHKRTRSLVYSSRRKADPSIPKEETKQELPAVALNTSAIEPAVLPSDPNPDPLVNQAEIAPEDAETNSDGKTAPIEVAENQSTASWVTSKSQQIYIAELEQLLREERKKRILAEQILAQRTN